MIKTQKQYLYLVAFLIMLPILMFTAHRMFGGGSIFRSEFSHHTPARAVYWWKTVYDPDSTELAFLREHDITRMYVRYFDVIYDPANRPEPIVPNATLQFRQSFPDSVEIIPTIYITNEAMGSWPADRNTNNYSWDPVPFKSTEYYVDQIVYRIKAMNTRNGVGEVHEVQVDCDWTRSTRPNFFRFCQALRERLHSEGIALSSTIRLHQLRDEAPPVDRGVLMCYNTGALRHLSTKNSILHPEDVYSHLKGRSLKKFGLPMDVAYPTFGWSVMYAADGKYVGLVKTTDLSDAELFEPQPNGLFKVLRDCSAGHAIIKAGNMLRKEESEFSTISHVKAQIDINRDLSDPEYSTILYHLDSNNLSKYSNEEIESIYK